MGRPSSSKTSRFYLRGQWLQVYHVTNMSTNGPPTSWIKPHSADDEFWDGDMVGFPVVCTSCSVTSEKGDLPTSSVYPRGLMYCGGKFWRVKKFIQLHRFDFYLMAEPQPGREQAQLMAVHKKDQCHPSLNGLNRVEVRLQMYQKRKQLEVRDGSYYHFWDLKHRQGGPWINIAFFSPNGDSVSFDMCDQIRKREDNNLHSDRRFLSRYVPEPWVPRHPRPGDKDFPIEIS